MRTNAVMSTLSCAQLKPAVAVLANREISNSFRHVSLQRSAAQRAVSPTVAQWSTRTESQKANGKSIGTERCTALRHCGWALTGRW